MALSLLTKREAATRARVSERMIDRLTKADPSLPVTRLGRRVLFPESEFDEWLGRQTRSMAKVEGGP